MERTLIFIDKKDICANSIGAGHQLLGITHKGKYVLGNTFLDHRLNKVQMLNMSYAVN